jgi:hypothetical protein
MFRFSIRELMLVTLVVAVCVAWWVDRRMLAAHLTWFEARLAPLEEEFRNTEETRYLIAREKEEFDKRLRERYRLSPPEVILPESGANPEATTSAGLGESSNLNRDEGKY